MNPAYIKSIPFRPFTARLSDVSMRHVPHEVFIFFPPGRSDVVIIVEKEIIHLIDVEQIIEIDYNELRLP